MNGSLYYTRGTGLILGAEKGGGEGSLKHVFHYGELSLRQVNNLINGHQTFEPRKTGRLNQFHATFALVRSFSNDLLCKTRRRSRLARAAREARAKKKDTGLYRSFLKGPGACFSKVAVNFKAQKAVLCLLCLHSRSKFQKF